MFAGLPGFRTRCWAISTKTVELLHKATEFAVGMDFEFLDTALIEVVLNLSIDPHQGADLAFHQEVE